MTTSEALDVALIGMADRGDHPPCFGLPGHVSDDPLERRLATQICDGCPVRELCAAVADERGESFGVWGGVDRTPRHYKRRSTD